MLLVGLTGGIGSGKSTVARMLAARGAIVIDSDVLARDAVARDTPGFRRVVELFGPDVLGPGGELDRKKLADLVFNDDRLRGELEAIVHPEVRRRIAETIGEHSGTDRVVIVDTPLLFETGSEDAYEVVVVVDAAPETRIARLAARGMDPEDVRARLASQMPLEEKAARADVVLDNEGTVAELEAQVAGLWEQLRARGGSPAA